ncbi:glyoxylate/hydroxypyruvate reductase A [Trinickia symbiotica]|uniref:Glyoxylate/hydroxypyruvate reductase A n=1 Tax=Trinickia symbiotica TaxID=863227 RepID=A0A2N7WZQ8_9BURK|nr:glyoxylate/hydroxypyruvate reductase A [Trinickia symbiotica]PMS34988.1 glyoxylate/hydroxypyruvate reductase A [Trinickia symbiotica]PPK43475.1 glyoxylate/hydroxypyruvate reductase A [Trinickia symbiotica]
MTKLVLVGHDFDINGLRSAILAAAPDLHVCDFGEPGATDAEVAVCWDPPHGALRTLSNLRLVHAIAAGVDNILADPELPRVPLCRVVDPVQARGMAEFVLWGVLHFHRQFDRVLANQRDRRWDMPQQRPASDVTVGVMGLGRIGAHVAATVASIGFRVRGWSRTPKTLSGIETFAGSHTLPSFLDGLDVLVCLLPLTRETEGIVGDVVLRRLPRGAKLIHVGRGEQLVLDALVAALSDGHLGGAIVDVFPHEPLPPHDALWGVPNLIVTPHMASAASLDAIAGQVVENVRRLQRNDSLIHQVDVELGF